MATGRRHPGREPVPGYVLRWAAQRQAHRDHGDYAAADALRERIAGAGYDVADTPQGPVVTVARRYRTVTPEEVADRREAEDAHEASVLLLLDAFGQDEEPAWLVGDASRCLAAVLAYHGHHDLEVVICDNGVGGAAGDWAADAARNPGITAIHLAEPMGFAAARALQHTTATGRLLLWLDTGVELTGDLLTPLGEAFAPAAVGAVGRWGGALHPSGREFVAVDPPVAGLRDVDAVWGYLLALRRQPLRTGAVTLDLGMHFYRHADVDLCYAMRAAGLRTVVTDLPAVQHGHRGFEATPAAIVERESRRNWRRLRRRWGAAMGRTGPG